MKTDQVRISGSMIQAFVICPRQTWLMSRNLYGNQYNDFLAIGRLLSEETYKRDKKEIVLDGNKFDVIRGKDGIINLIETKKSSKMLEASEMQLLFYMYSLKDKVKEIKGEIRVPAEKKVIPIELTMNRIKDIKEIISSAQKIIKNEKPPERIRIKYCKTCSYNEFCWA